MSLNILTAYPLMCAKLTETFTSLKEQASTPLADYIEQDRVRWEQEGLVHDDEQRAWIAKHHEDLQKYRDINVQEQVISDLLELEKDRREKYPQYTASQWDYIQAHELFDNDGEPLAYEVGVAFVDAFNK